MSDPLPSAQVPVLEPADCFTVMTFNIAHGRGTRFHQTLVSRAVMERNLHAIAEQIQSHQPHVVALQEIDQHSFWNHHVDQLAFLQALTAYDHALHGIHKDAPLILSRWMLRYGVGLLSRLEPLEAVSEAFQLGRLDSKGFARKLVQFAQKRIMVIGVHLDFQRHSRRLAQVERLIAHVRAQEGTFDHLVIMGDFNCSLYQAQSALHYLMEQLHLHTWEQGTRQEHISFPAPGPLANRLDYVLVDQGLTFESYNTSRVRLSDHEYVVARLRWA
ncbi:MAG: endonuclease/exonuclease/phosphatase family protein [Myxococcota bacterium]